jgi:hypothetical protein
MFKNSGEYVLFWSIRNHKSVNPLTVAYIFMGGRTTYRTLSPKRAPFQIGVDWWSHLRKVPRRRRISHTYSMWLRGHSIFKISSPGPVLHGTKWLLWRPHIQSPTLNSRCGINKRLIKRGSTMDHWRSQCKGWILCPTPNTYIHHTFFFPYVSVPGVYVPSNLFQMISVRHVVCCIELKWICVYVAYFTTLSVSSLCNVLYDAWSVGKNLEGSYRGLIEVLSLHNPEGTEETHEKP